jgi:hypothetical protein
VGALQVGEYTTGEYTTGEYTMGEYTTGGAAPDDNSYAVSGLMVGDVEAGMDIDGGSLGSAPGEMGAFQVGAAQMMARPMAPSKMAMMAPPKMLPAQVQAHPEVKRMQQQLVALQQRVRADNPPNRVPGTTLPVAVNPPQPNQNDIEDTTQFSRHGNEEGRHELRRNYETADESHIFDHGSLKGSSLD